MDKWKLVVEAISAAYYVVWLHPVLSLLFDLVDERAYAMREVNPELVSMLEQLLWLARPSDASGCPNHQHRAYPMVGSERRCWCERIRSPGGRLWMRPRSRR